MQPPIHIGTSGFSYPEWVEAGVYPPKTKSAHMLSLYAGEFPIVELNYTWYQMVRTETVERMLSRVPPSFLFTAKLTRTMTHEISHDWKQQAGLYVRGIKPLQQSGSLVAVLLQFPGTFTRSRTNRYYLAQLLDELASLPLAIEFRHRSWASDQVFSGLQERNITLTTVDAPSLPQLFPLLNVVTNPDLFYVRLHGRNASGWFSGTMHRQFNYDYSQQELTRLLETTFKPIQDKCSTGVVFFNNHVAGQAVRNARMLKTLLHHAAS